MGSEIWITFQTSTEYCSLEIKTQMAESLSAEELKAMFREFCNRGDDINNEPIARFSLAKSYADCMHLGLHASITDEKLFQVRVSNIKLV